MGKAGDRVGAICNAKNGVVQFFGFGVYEGDFKYGDDTSDPKPAGWVTDLLKSAIESTNPRIRLDSGEVVWGCECWWGPESEIQKQLEKYDKVVDVSVSATRAEVVRISTEA